jgi:hypothetical protein
MSYILWLIERVFESSDVSSYEHANTTHMCIKINHGREDGSFY